MKLWIKNLIGGHLDPNIVRWIKIERSPPAAHNTTTPDHCRHTTDERASETPKPKPEQL